MTTDKFLETEFGNFIKKFDKQGGFSDDFNFETPPFELETIKQVHFDTKIVLNKLKCVIMPSLITGNESIFSESLEIFNNIIPVNIKYKRLEERKTSHRVYSQFKLTMMSTNLSMN